MNTEKLLAEAEVDAVRRAETRRALFNKGALVAGGLGLAALAHPEVSSAEHGAGLKGFNSVMDILPDGRPGATGNGTTNDTEAIQGWIDVSQPGGSHPGAVYFPPPPGGSYRVEHNIDLRSGTVLIGHGARSELKKLDNNPGSMLRIDGISDVLIENLKLNGNRAGNPDSNGAALVATSGNRVFVRGVEAFDMATTRGISLQSVAVLSIQGCYVHDCDRDGIAVYSSEDVVVVGNVVNNCGDDAIAAGGTRVAVVANVCNALTTSFGAPIAVRAGGQVAVVGNTCRGGAQAGIAVVTASDVEIVANMIPSAGVTTGPNPLRGPGQGSGIAVWGAPARVTIKDNIISSPFAHGVRLTTASGAARDVAVSGNMISMGASATGSGIVSDNLSDDITDVRITDNDIRNANTSGIEVTGSRNKRWDIRGNRILDSGRGGGTSKSGIRVDGAIDVSITDNRAQDTRPTGKTQDYGLTLLNPGGRTLVTDNDFSNNGSGAINPPPGPPPGSNPYIFDNVGVAPLN
jgi:parallel beta-helix repeat protein